mmetsp:Transcript_60651/g.141843  ORF Transcript_60651/g.141843 Transcript_60651/m.141843 type:complete len:201 (+) Transcript_60651:217-819(+)
MEVHLSQLLREVFQLPGDGPRTSRMAVDIRQMPRQILQVSRNVLVVVQVEDGQLAGQIPKRHMHLVHLVILMRRVPASVLELLVEAAICKSGDLKRNQAHRAYHCRIVVHMLFGHLCDHLYVLTPVSFCVQRHAQGKQLGPGFQKAWHVDLGCTAPCRVYELRNGAGKLHGILYELPQVICIKLCFPVLEIVVVWSLATG